MYVGVVQSVVFSSDCGRKPWLIVPCSVKVCLSFGVQSIPVFILFPLRPAKPLVICSKLYVPSVR